MGKREEFLIKNEERGVEATARAHVPPPAGDFRLGMGCAVCEQ